MKLPWLHSMPGFTVKDRPYGKILLADRLLKWCQNHIESPLPVYLFDLFAVVFGQPEQKVLWKLKLYKRVSDMDPKVSKYLLVGKGFWIPTKIQKTMAEDDEAYVRITLASRPDLKKKVIKILAKDAYPHVIKSLINNPTVNETLRTELALRLPND